MSRDYFTLRKPLERRIYELARKHCGAQPIWRVSVETLCKKSGSASPRRVFRAMLREIIKAGTLPEYNVTEEPGDIIAFSPRAVLVDPRDAPTLSEDALIEARRLRPGMDVYALQADWLSFWAKTGRKPLRSADKAFLGWVAKTGTDEG